MVNYCKRKCTILKAIRKKGCIKNVAAIALISFIPFNTTLASNKESAINDSIFITANDSTDTSKYDGSNLYGMIIESNPQFPGGDKAIVEWIKQNLRYPEEAKKEKIEGRVLVSCIINTDGTVSDAKITRSTNNKLNEEALRLVSSMPKWIPRTEAGKNVKTKYTVPIKFTLENNDSTETRNSKGIRNKSVKNGN